MGKNLVCQNKKCKVIEKCKKCQCCQAKSQGLADKINVPRPTERVIERQIVELATRCEDCGCNKEATNAREEP